jgi:serine protease Do
MDKKDIEFQDEVIQTNSSTTEETPRVEVKHKSSFKKLLIKLILFFLSIGVLASLIGFLWLGGYMNTWLCSTVQEESVLWDRFSCDGKTSVVDGNEDYSYEEKDDQNIMVTDLESVVTKVVAESSDSVVGIGIAGRTNAADQIIGSGFVVSSNGLVVTNQHVVSGGDATDFFVVVGEESDPIQVEKIYRDEVNDIALLKLPRTDLKVLPLGDSTNIKVGQTAIAIGNPLGSLSNTVTVGSISALNREVELSDDYYRFSSRTHFDVIQTDAAINPGNSGGPLLNSNGEVVGVNFATISGADNLSFALPINLVKQRIQELNEFGDFRLPFLGVEYQRRLVFYRNEGVVGAIVMNVIENSPAATAGILEGDVIVQFAGKDLEDESLLNLIQRSKIGEEVEIVVIRDGESETIKVTIADRNEFN